MALAPKDTAQNVRMGQGVKTKHAQYDYYSRKWKRCRDVVAGQDAVHDAKTLYLPRLKDQVAEEYDSYTMRAPFFNASWRTVAGFVGMLFRKPPTLEVPSAMEDMLDDITLSGVSFHNFAQQVVLENLTVSRVGVLVDHPPLKTNDDGSVLSVAQAEQLTLRPYMALYKAESIINWKMGRVNNKWILTQVRLVEIAENTDEGSEFEFNTKKQIKVLDLVDGVTYRQRIFDEETENQIGDDIIPLMNGKPLDNIPFFFIGPDGIESEFEEPVLIDLFDLNLAHYRVAADYEHGCHMTGLPTPWVTGYQQPDPNKPDQFYIGSTSAWVFADPNAKVGFLEFTGQGLTALENNLNRKEAQMASIGARMLAPDKAGVEAAETIAMRNSGEQSVLSAIALASSNGLEDALEVFAEWAGFGEDVEINFQINRDFMPYGIEPTLLQALLAAVQAGKISNESFFDLLKRGDLVEADLTFEEEQARIDSQPPPMPFGLPAPKPGAPFAGGPRPAVAPKPVAAPKPAD